MFFKNNVLVVVAHPDDEVIGCGGTVIKHVQNGDKVSVVVLADGVTSRPKSPAKAQKKRWAEFAACARILGVQQIFKMGFKDQLLDTVPLLRINQELEKIIRKTRPNLIYTHHRNDLNLDHRRTFEATLTACRPKPGTSITDIYSFEIPSSTEWNYPALFNPNVYQDISAVFSKKVSALQAYQSELLGREYPDPLSLKALEILAQKRGCESGLQYAEAFELIRRVAK